MWAWERHEMIRYDIGCRKWRMSPQTSETKQKGDIQSSVGLHRDQLTSPQLQTSRHRQSGVL